MLEDMQVIVLAQDQKAVNYPLCIFRDRNSYAASTYVYMSHGLIAVQHCIGKLLVYLW